MRYDSAKHHRRSIRLKGYDYTQPGSYFITICTYQKQYLFSSILDKQLILSDFGKIASEYWQAIPKHFPTIELDKFVIMPNHIHGILIITDNCKGKAINRRGKALSCPYNGEFGNPIAGSIPTIIGSYKSSVTKRINILRNSPGTKVWQRNYYEHIIRMSWENDQLHPNNYSK